MRVVRPEWLVESAKAGTLLPWQNYAFNPVGRIDESQGGKRAQTGLNEFMSQTRSTRIDAGRDLDVESPSQEDMMDTTKHESDLPTSTRPTSPSKPRTSAFSKFPSKPDKAIVQPPSAAQPEVSEMPSYASKESNPVAQRVMADPEWRSANTSAGAGFIKGYYENSRLHHLSTWKAELRGLVAEALARAEKVEAKESGWIKEGGGGDGTKGDEEMEGNGGIAGVSMRSAELVMRSPSKGKAKAVEVEDKVIMHCDFDSFFVAAGLVDRPHLRGKPVVVCHSQGNQGGLVSTSEIASSSYEARKFGIKNGMRYLNQFLFYQIKG